jgi:hypothetical protein
MKNVLLPTDFSANSLDPIEIVAKMLPDKLNILLFHAFDMPQSLLEAFSKVGLNGHGNLVTEELRIKCKRIKQSHRNVQNICFRPMYGVTTMAFKNYSEANKIHLIALPPGYRFAPAVRESVDPTRMFQKSGIEILNKFNDHMVYPLESEANIQTIIQPI